LKQFVLHPHGLRGPFPPALYRLWLFIHSELSHDFSEVAAMCQML
jgi:hypothetical protein